MACKRKFIVSEEISPLNIALTLLVKLYLSNLLTNQRSIVYILVKYLEGRQYDQTKELKVAPTLCELCEAFLECQVDGNSTRMPPHSNSHGLSAKLAIFNLLDLAWSIESEEDMHLQINEANSLLLDPNTISSGINMAASPRSIIGRFLQRIVVAAKLLHFDESMLVFQSFCHFRESSRSYYETFKMDGFDQLGTNQRAHSVGSTTEVRNHMDDFNKTSEDNQILDAMLYKSLNDQLGLITSTATLPEEDVVVTPHTKAELDSLIDAQINFLERYGSPTSPALRSIMEQLASPYLEFSTVHRGHSGPSPSIHYLRYLEHLHEGNYLAAFDSLHQYFDYMVSQGSRYFYHFALIARASLHQCFGEDQKALDSIEEAISVARENKDNGTLTYVLSWLFNFMKDKPTLWVSQTSFQNNGELQLLDFLSRKSQTVSLLLAAVSFCFVTESYLSNGDPSEKLCESLFRALYVSINDGTPSFVKCSELASLVWCKLGVPYLNELYVDTGLTYALKFGSKSDVLDLSLKKQVGIFWRENPESAMNELRQMLKTYTGNVAQYQRLQKQILLLQIESSLRSGKVLLARESIDVLLNSGDMDEESKLDVIRLNSSLLVANENTSGAIQWFSREISNSTKRIRPNLFNSIRLNLIKTRLLIHADANSRALSLIAQHIKIAKGIGFGAVLMEALVQMISLLNNIQSVDEANRIGLRLIPAVTRTQNQKLVAALYFELARCSCVFLETSSNRLNRKELFTNFLRFLSIAISGYKKSMDLKLLVECFRLEQRVAVAGADFKDEIANTIPFQNFKSHSQAGLEILRKKVSDESNLGYLKS